MNDQRVNRAAKWFERANLLVWIRNHLTTHVNLMEQRSIIYRGARFDRDGQKRVQLGRRRVRIGKTSAALKPYILPSSILDPSRQFARPFVRYGEFFYLSLSLCSAHVFG